MHLRGVDADLVGDQIVVELVIYEQERHVDDEQDQQYRYRPDEDVSQDQPMPYLPQQFAPDHGDQTPEVVGRRNGEEHVQQA